MGSSQSDPYHALGSTKGEKKIPGARWSGSCIDDGARAGVNDATFDPENLVMPTFEFPARAGFALAEENNGGTAPFGLFLGLEDLFAAYRRFGTSTPHATVVGVYNVDTSVVE
jgi:hypothetical protein